VKGGHQHCVESNAVVFFINQNPKRNSAKHFHRTIAMIPSFLFEIDLFSPFSLVSLSLSVTGVCHGFTSKKRLKAFG
jgi:hypothetical protein